MRDSAAEIRAAQARARLGQALDDLEGKFAPSHVWRMGLWALRRSLVSHRVGWGVAAAVGVALVAGWVLWAVASRDDED